MRRLNQVLGVGIGWRPELDLTVERLPGVDFVEVIAEQIDPGRLPESLRVLRDRGVTVIPHGVGLGLGGAELPDPRRLAHLTTCAAALDAPLVSEHVAVVRAGGWEAGHLLPVPHTRLALDVLVDNVRRAQAELPVPLALENVATLFEWPGSEMTEGAFLSELVARTGVGLLVDVANLHTNRVNQGLDVATTLAELPLAALAYVHVAGGQLRDGVWFDTHTHPPGEEVFQVLAALCARVRPPGMLLEWDGHYPSDQVLAETLARIRSVAQPAEAAGGAAVGPPAVQPACPAGREPDRARLARDQADLLAALVAGGPVPSGFDPHRLRRQAALLAARRRR